MFSKPVTHLLVDFPSWLASLQPLASLCWFSPAFSIVIDNCSLSAMLQGSKLQPWAAECCPLCLSLTGAFQSSNWSFCFHQTRATWEVHPFRQGGVGPLPWITAVPQWGAAGLQQLKFSEMHTALSAWEGTWTQQLMAKQVPMGAQLIPVIFKVAPLPTKKHLGGHKVETLKLTAQFY